jgi:hypothetical protein
MCPRNREGHRNSRGTNPREPQSCPKCCGFRRNQPLPPPSDEVAVLGRQTAAADNIWSVQPEQTKKKKVIYIRLQLMNDHYQRIIILLFWNLILTCGLGLGRSDRVEYNLIASCKNGVETTRTIEAGQPAAGTYGN